MHETENHINISQCHFVKRLAFQSEFSGIAARCVTGGDPTLDSPQHYPNDLSSSHAWFAWIYRDETSEQGPVWATQRNFRRGAVLFELRMQDSASDFALMFRSGSDREWPCIGCAWKPTSPEAENTSADLRIIREYIMGSGIFRHALLKVIPGEIQWLVCVPSRLFALMQAYKASHYFMIPQPTYQEVMQTLSESESYESNHAALVESYE